MRPPKSEQALRRVIARLANATAQDIDDVLAALDPAQREEVRALLAAARGAPDAEVYQAPPAAPPLRPIDAGPLPTGISSWLVERLSAPLDSVSQTASAGGFLLTANAQLALRRALEVLPEPTPVLVAAKPAGRSGGDRWPRLFRAGNARR